MSVPRVVPTGHVDSVDCPCTPTVTRKCIECDGERTVDGEQCWLCDGLGVRPATGYDMSAHRAGRGVELFIEHQELPTLQADGFAIETLGEDRE
jgi:hypothetical protein